MVFSQTNIEAGIMFGTSLANNDVTRFGCLASEEFHPKSFTL
jgi:hypothetical protein